MHLVGQLREHGRLVARAGADVEHALAAAQRERLADAATMYGCEIVWPAPIGSAASSYARGRSGSGTKQLARDRAHRVEHARRRAMSRARSCCVTIRWREETGSNGPAASRRLRVRRRADPEVRERGRREVDDRAGSRVDADRHHRHLGVARDERAVAAAAGVVAAAEVGELAARGRGDEHLAGVRVRERRPTRAPGASG